MGAPGYDRLTLTRKRKREDKMATGDFDPNLTATGALLTQQQFAQAQNSYTGGTGIGQLSGSYITPGGGYVTGNHVYYPSGSWTAVSPYPYESDEDDWTSKDNQEAAGLGWLLINGHYSPEVVALSFGAKKDWSEERILQDVVESCMTGVPIALKILKILSRNRSEYAQWQATVDAVENAEK